MRATAGHLRRTIISEQQRRYIISKDFDDFQKHKEAASKVLLESGISHTNFNPPVIRVIEWLGIRTKPPHFASFISIAAMYAIYFGVIWGLIMWRLVWRTSLMSPAMALASAAGTGLAFGVAMASYYAWVRKKHKLPTWDALVSR